MKRKTFVLIAIGVCVAGCASVELQYQSPAQDGKFAAIAKQATDQYQYVELSEMYLKVAPDAAEPKPKAADGAAPAAAVAADKPAKATPVATSDAAPAPSVAGKKEKVPKKATGASTAKTGAPSATPKAAAASEKTADDSKPKPLDSTLASATIDGKKWIATVVPVPSSGYGFMVRGVSGFWHSTTISISRYDNSNVASSISSKAENLVAKRLGQFAGAAVSLVKLGAAVGVADVVKPPAEPLLPFSLKVPNGNDNGKLNNGWTWAFEYDADEPSSTVTFEEFMSGVASNKVAYWPVPACRSGVLTVFPPSNDPVKYQYSFNVVVSSPEYVRLQSVPIDGKLSPGVVCSASETGTATADPLQTVSDDLAALQQGIQKVKAAKKPAAAAPAASADKQQ